MTAPSAAAARQSIARTNAVSRFWHSSVGKKAVMAVTGLVMIGFLLVHVLGNLQVFSGPLKINEYSAALRRLGPLLWIARGGLIVALVLHVIAAYQLTRRMQTARPVGYAVQDPQVSKAHMGRIVIIGEGKRVVRVEPPVVEVAPLCRPSDLDHGTPFRGTKYVPPRPQDSSP